MRAGEAVRRMLAMLAVVGVAAGGADHAVAQYHDLSVPADSTMWWALSDRITPAELKELLSNRELSLARYDEAVKAGLEAPLSNLERGRLELYVNHGKNPELVPMWWAFDVFAAGYLHLRRADLAGVERELARHGLSAGGIAAVLATTNACQAEREELMVVLGPRQREMQRLLGDRFAAERASETAGGPPLDKAMGDKPILESIKELDYDRVALVVGRPASEIRDLVDALAVWGRPGGASWIVAECLPVLRSRVSDSDWMAFQRFLKDVIVSPIAPLKVLGRATEARR